MTIKLKYCNDLGRLEDHISAAHTLHLEAGKIGNILSRINQTVFHQVVCPEERIRVPQPARPSGVMIPEDMRTNGIHYLAYWLHQLLSNDLIGPDHLFYQEVDAMVELALRYPNPVPPSWKYWPTLSAYVEKLNALFFHS